MTKNFLEKRDLKALTTLSLYASLENDQINKNNIIFVTNFGLVFAKKVLSPKFEEETLTPENYSRFIMQSTVNNTSEVIKENNNEDILDDLTSFVLEDVQIKSFNNDQVTNLTTMILFSDSILGLTFGNLND
ncbi:hypothetical protein FOA22_22590 [Heyndrickxia oleronia]|uniref:hypothetical protein n=1 Tax=Heyndrickxia oleronia TaxID=38875 RepID=UPI00333D2C8E